MRIKEEEYELRLDGYGRIKIVIIGENDGIVKIVKKGLLAKKTITLFLLPSTNQTMAISNSIWKRKFTEPTQVKHLVWREKELEILSKLFKCHSVEELEKSIENNEIGERQGRELFVTIRELFYEMFSLMKYF